MTKLLPCRFQQCFGTFNMLTDHKHSDTGLFRLLVTTLFEVYNFGNTSAMRLTSFFQNAQNLM